jgi:phosphotransferase system enzyme I (PtsI)
MTDGAPTRRVSLTGAAIAPGLVLGQAHLLRQISLDALQLTPLPVSDAAEEIERLDLAVDQTLAQLRQLRSTVNTSNRRDLAEVLETQEHLLEDVAFLGRIREAVRTQGINAEYLIATEVGQLETTFGGMADEVLRSRFLDIQDVYHRLLRNLLEIEHVRTNPFRKLVSPIVLVADRMLPSDVALLELGKVLGIVLEEGSRVSHVAIIARSLAIPALTEVAQATRLVRSGDTVLLDADAGQLVVHPSADDVARYEGSRRGRPSVTRGIGASAGKILPCATADGVRVVLEANVGSVREAEEAWACGAEGVGLLRSEFFYMSSRQMPTAEAEERFYHEVVETMCPRPVTVRLLDVGADKSPPYLAMPREQNPQLGARGVRALLRMPELLRRHVSAVLRAGTAGPVRVLLPFVSTVADLDRMLEVIRAGCCQDRISRASFQIGLMVEVPAVALGLSRFVDRVDFLSIGTNDLVQYMFAASREDAHVEEYCIAHHPVMLQLIRTVARAADAANKPVSVCGEIASDPMLALVLVGLGVRSLSVHPTALGPVRENLRRYSSETLAQMARRCLRATSAAEVLTFLNETIAPGAV